MSQSLVNEGGGARTPVSSCVRHGQFSWQLSFFFTHLLRALPQPVLAAVGARGRSRPLQRFRAQTTLAQ
jgi:MFS superfamily sulfate permease-like transporter